MKFIKIISIILCSVLAADPIYALGYGGAIQNTENDRLLYLECTAEDLTREAECTEFQVVTSDLNGSNKKRQNEFTLKEYSQEDIILILEKQFKYTINDNTDDSWFNSTGIIAEGLGYVGDEISNVSPKITSAIVIIFIIPALFVIPTIGLTTDLLKSPVVAIKDSVLKGNAKEMTREILEHLLDRNTVEAMELEEDYFYDSLQSIIYRMKQ